MWDKRAQFVSNHDGDTVTMILDQGFYETKQIDVRLLGVFAPELNQPGGTECRDFVRRWFMGRISNVKNWDFVVITARMKVADAEQKSFDRYIGTITSIDGTENLNADIIQFIHDNNYPGGVGS